MKRSANKVWFYKFAKAVYAIGLRLHVKTYNGKTTIYLSDKHSNPVLHRDLDGELVELRTKHYSLDAGIMYWRGIRAGQHIYIRSTAWNTSHVIPRV